MSTTPVSTTQNPQKLAMRVSAVSIAANILLSLFKAFAGIVAHSSAMLTDAIHSATDVVSTFVMMIGLKMAGRKADKTHPYGYERMESLAAIVLSMILAAAGLGVGTSGLEKIITGNYGSYGAPGLLALVAALVSIGIKEGMYWYMRWAGKRLRSGAMMAEAWHQRSDAFSSIGSFVGILGARMGLPVLDSMASLLICGFILKTALDIFRDAANKLTDKACSGETRQAIADVIKGEQGVLGLRQMKTRLFGEKIYVEADVLADGSLPLHQADLLEDGVRMAVEEAFPQVKRCSVRAVAED